MAGDLPAPLQAGFCPVPCASFLLLKVLLEQTWMQEGSPRDEQDLKLS